MIKALCSVALAAAALVTQPVWGFDGKLAAEKSAALTQPELDEAWSHFEAAAMAAKKGNNREALKRFRQGLITHPAELSAHLMAARLAESEGQFGVAAAHWQAIAALASPTSTEADQAAGASKRLAAKQEAGAAVSCAVFGQVVSVHASQCDDPTRHSLLATPGHAAPAPQAGSTAAEKVALAPRKQIRVQAYAGPEQPSTAVATVYGVDGWPSLATRICQVSGSDAVFDGKPVTVAYLLPGNYKLGWCYTGDGREAQGFVDIKVRSGRVYQVNAVFVGRGRWTVSFAEMPTTRLTLRNIAPWFSGRPDIDDAIPYGPN